MEQRIDEEGGKAGRYDGAEDEVEHGQPHALPAQRAKRPITAKIARPSNKYATSYMADAPDCAWRLS